MPLSQRLTSAAPYVIAGIAILLTALFHFFFAEVPYGIPLAIMVVSSIIGIFSINEISGISYRPWTLWILVPLLLLSLANVIYASPVVRVLGVLISFVLLILFAYWSSAPTTHLHQRHTLFPIKLFFETLWPFRRMQQFFIAFSSRGTGVHILLGVIVALPFLIIFGALFASADQLIRKTIFDLFRDVRFGEIIAKTIRDVIVAVLLLGTGWTIYLRSRDEAAQKPLTTIGLNEIIMSTFFALLNLLFLIFIGFQFAAFFGGEQFLRDQGLTYSSYAVSGYFQLLAVAAIVFVISWFVYRMTNIPGRIVRWLSLALLLQTGIVIASAVTRLSLYVDAYGWTLSRWWAMLTILIIAAVLTTIAIGMILRRAYHVMETYTFLGLILAISIVLLFPHDATIARLNVKRFIKGQGPAFDIDYHVYVLSSDAIPTVIRAYRDPRVRARLSASEIVEFTRRLDIKKSDLTTDFEHDDWRYQVISDYQALAAFGQLDLR